MASSSEQLGYGVKSLIRLRKRRINRSDIAFRRSWPNFRLFGGTSEGRHFLGPASPREPSPYKSGYRQLAFPPILVDDDNPVFRALKDGSTQFAADLRLNRSGRSRTNRSIIPLATESAAGKQDHPPSVN
jgi:hypothetical protein